MAKFVVWKTIKLGTDSLKTAADFRQAIESRGMRTGWASNLMSQPAFSVAAKETEINLVAISPADLGLPDGVNLQTIYSRARELGLELCPPEVGPRLRLEHADQPEGEWLFIAMKPIADTNGYPGIFSVGHNNDGRWLGGDGIAPSDSWAINSRFIFVLPGK